jgi:aldehyde decarbonylase
VFTVQPLTVLLARDDMIIFNCIGLTLLGLVLPGWQALPAFNAHGLLIMLLLHASVAEWLYYWLHRALHHHWLFTRYYSHHHQSFVTEPISGTYARRCCRRK